MQGKCLISSLSGFFFNRSVTWCPSPCLNYWGTFHFWFSKSFWEGLEFFTFYGGGWYGGLAKIGCEGKDSNIKSWFVYLFFHFLNLARSYSCIILTVLSCYALRNLVLFLQFEIREKHTWKTVTFSKVTLIHVCF